jgi:hypothetical protein
MVYAAVVTAAGLVHRYADPTSKVANSPASTIAAEVREPAIYIAVSMDSGARVR